MFVQAFTSLFLSFTGLSTLAKGAIILTLSFTGTIVAQALLHVPWEQLVLQVPAMVVLAFIVWVFVKHLDKCDVRWAKRIESIGELCHARGDALQDDSMHCISANTEAMKEFMKVCHKAELTQQRVLDTLNRKP